jgi:hypothetical protein
MTKNTKMQKTQKRQMSVFVQNCKRKRKEIFAFCVITFEPIIDKTGYAHQNDHQNLSFVKDEDTYGKKMARKGRTEVISKGTFVSERSLIQK